MTDPLSPSVLLVAFAGGAFGALVGALPAFSLTGAAVVVGETWTRLAPASAVDLTGQVAFGPVLGPHVAFGGGAAALAYAARWDRVDLSDAPDPPPKAVTVPLGARPDVLAVGGVFGVFGHLVAVGAGAVPLPVDPVALGVVVSALAHRVAFGYGVLGAAPLGRLRVAAGADARPSTAPGDADAAPTTDGGGPAVPAPWLPYQSRWRDVTALGVVVGAPSAYVAYLTASPFLAFGVAAATLSLLVVGVPRVPVAHHVALPASTGALALAGVPAGELTPAVAASVPLWQALAVGTALGVAGALLGEVAARALYAHAETHLDPPAASIALTSLLVAALTVAGVLPSAVWVPTP